MREQITPENRRTSPFRKLVTGHMSIQVIVTVMAAIAYVVLQQFLDLGRAAAITSAIFIPMYVSMTYTFCWGAAERERNMVKFGHMEEDLTRGWRSGLYSVIPLLVFSIVVIVLAYTGNGSNIIGIYRICTAPFLSFVNPLIEYAPFALPVTVIFAPLAGWWGYHNGNRLYRVWDHILYKDGIKKKRKNSNEPRARRTAAEKGEPRTRRTR